MERMNDYYFRRNGNIIALTEDPLANQRLIPLEKERSRDESEFSKIPEEKDNQREHLTATYWG